MKNPVTYHIKDVREYAYPLNPDERRWLECFINGMYGGNLKSLEMINGAHLHEVAKQQHQAAHRDIFNLTDKERDNPKQYVRRFKNSYTSYDYLDPREVNEDYQALAGRMEDLLIHNIFKTTTFK